MAARKRYFRDALGRFAKREPSWDAVKADLAADKGPLAEQVHAGMARGRRIADIPTLTDVAYQDPISVGRRKPRRWLWLERALQWFTWNRSRA